MRSLILAVTLAIAREGRYPAAIEADVSEERLHRFFSREGDHYQVRRELRARYPRHPWPEDPWTAPPTHRTKKR